MPGRGRGRGPADPGTGARDRAQHPGRSRFGREGLDAAGPRGRPARRSRAHRRRHVAARAWRRHRGAAPAGGLGAPAVLPEHDRIICPLSIQGAGRMRISEMLAGGMLALALSACGGEGPAADQASSTDETTAAGPTAAAAQDQAEAPAGAADTTEPADPGAGGVLDRAGQPIEFVSFDVQGVPPGSAALGELPFVAMPDGYGIINKPSVRAFARFPVRMGEGLHWVEGTTWAGRIGIARERRRDKEFSELELRRNLDAVLEQAGAQQVFEGPLRRELYYGDLEQEIGQGFIDGVNLDANIPTRVYVIRQPDRTAWVQLSIGARQAAMVVVEER